MSRQAASDWQQLAEWLTRWFFEPDLQSLEIVLAACTAHYHSKADPVWLLDVRVPGSGKTSVNVEAALGLPQAHLICDISPKTFMSHYGGTDGKSFLRQIGSAGILIVKDFSSLLGKRPDQRSELTSQLRELADGRYTKRTGAAEVTLWEGKITLIAAATPAMERAWSVMRELGERFLTVRTRRVNGVKAAEKARAQRGHEKEIAKGIRELALQFVDPTHLPPAPDAPPEHMHALDYMAEVVATLRTNVVRQDSGRGEIAFVDEPELPTRISKALEAVALGHAVMLRHDVLKADDLAVARRLAIDSIPPKRLSVLSRTATHETVPDYEIIRQLPFMHHATVRQTIEELSFLGVLATERSAAGDILLRHTPTYLELLGKANLT